VDCQHKGSLWWRKNIWERFRPMTSTASHPPPAPFFTPFWPHPAVTDLHANSSAQHSRDHYPNATDLGCTCGNPSRTTQQHTNGTNISTLVTPLVAGARCHNHYLAPCTTISDRLSTGPMATLPSSTIQGLPGMLAEDSETAKPDKFYWSGAIGSCTPL